jgi:peptidoglycan-associated lipoprotein
MRRFGVVAVLMTTMVAACHHAKAPAAVTPPPAATQPDTAGNGARDLAARMRADSIAREDAARRAAAGASSEARATLAEIVFFDYDKAEVRSDMQDVLNRKAAILRSNPGVTLRIDGHADERGTVEYNLALSLRRANTVREYLTNFGIDVSRLEVAGFGEEKPLDPGTTEEAYAKNRRAEFQITRGGDNLVPAR